MSKATKIRITGTNLLPYLGRKAHLYCQVGVLFDLSGTLEVGTLSTYALRLPDGNRIQFRYGEFLVDGSEDVRVYVV